MAESIITDSSDYSEDFESSSESLPDFLESDVFPQLFNYLEKSLSENKYINYRLNETPPQQAVGLFLSQAKLSKSDFINKLNWEYSQKKQLLRKPGKFDPYFSKFPKTLKSILCQMRSETDYLNLVTKRNQIRALDQIRSQAYLNLGALVKDKCQADSMLTSEKSAISKKSEELEDSFVWTRFNELLKALVPNKILLSNPNEKQRSEVKSLIDNYFKQGLTINNAVTLEDSDYNIALGNRKAFVTGPERKIEVTEVCQEMNRAEELLVKFLTFSKRHNKAKKLNPVRKDCLLNRAFINVQKGTLEDNLSQYLFVPENPQRLLDVQNFDFCTVEDDVSTFPGIVEINDIRVKGRELEVKVRGKHAKFRAATVEDLSGLPCSPVNDHPKQEGVSLYTLFQENFYSCKSIKKQYLRSLNSSELKELFKTYLYRESDSKVHPESFPDSRRPIFKHKYLVIKDSIILNSGIFSKHWLIQLKQSDPKKTFSELFLPKMCKWEVCMSPLVGEMQLTKMATEFSSLTNKVKMISKKGLNPLKKSRTASEAIVIPDLCAFHNNLRSIMRNDGLATKKLIYDNSIELWKATQSGVNWQEQLSESNKLSKLCSGSAKQLISGYLSSVFKYFSYKPVLEDLNEGFFSGQKSQLMIEVENLKKLKDIEESCTEDLTTIFTSGANSSYLKVKYKQYAVITIQEAVLLQTSSKCLKIRSLKDQIESFIALKQQNQSDLSIYQPHFRVSTAKQMELNNTYNDSTRKNKDEGNKKTVSPYYDPRLRVIKRFQKSRIPKTACEERVNYNKN